MEEVSWIKDCEICKDGLCARVEDLKDEGKCIREAARIMETECGGEWNAGVIRSRYNYYSNRTYKGGRKSTRQKNTPETPTKPADDPEVANSEVAPTDDPVTGPVTASNEERIFTSDHFKVKNQLNHLTSWVLQESEVNNEMIVGDSFFTKYQSEFHKNKTLTGKKEVIEVEIFVKKIK